MTRIAAAIALLCLGPSLCVGCSVEAAPPPAEAAMPTCATTPATLPDLAFEGVAEGGVSGTIRLRGYHAPCSATAPLLVVRLHGGAWCGTCLWHAAHTAPLVAHPRVQVLDAVFGDVDNTPATGADLAAFRAKVDVAARVATVADPDRRLASLLPPGGAVLPFFALVDTKTMAVRTTLENPDPDTLDHAIRATLAAMDGAPPPAPPTIAYVDGLFARNEWELLGAIAPPGAPPPDPTNAVADDPKAAALGARLFADPGLSGDGATSCQTCHDPGKQLSDGRPQATAAGLGDRRTPRIAVAAHARWQFWDGRADTLWGQALGPLENPLEMAGSRVHVVRRVLVAHGAAYRAAFPGRAWPDLSRLPAAGKPGDAAFDALDPALRAATTQVFVDVGKALAAYERTFRAPATRLDAYVAGELGALTPQEKTGLSLFLRHGCLQCHHGPRLTDDAFHVTRLPGLRRDGRPDEGRSAGIASLLAAEFTAGSSWADVKVPRAVRAHPSLRGAFKTPSLRGVATGGPFGHSGALATLVEVTEAYGKGGAAADDPHAVGTIEPWLPAFDVTSQWAIPSILEVLGGAPIVP